MKRQHQGFWVFITTLCLSLAALGVIFLGLTLWLKNTGNVAKANLVQSDIPAAPTEDESLSFVLLACPGAADPPALAVAFWYNAPAAALSAVTLPPETLVLQNGRCDTIAGHYEYEGVRGGVNAIRALLGDGLVRYFRTQSPGAANLTDFLGGVSVLLPEDEIRSGETFLAGEQLLDGRRMAAFLFDMGETGHTDAGLQAKLLGELLSGGFSPGAASRCKKLPDLLFYNCETNLSRYDLTSRAEGFAQAAEAGRLRTEVRALEGEYSPDGKRFFPAGDSLEAARALFPQKEEAESNL